MKKLFYYLIMIVLMANIAFTIVGYILSINAEICMGESTNITVFTILVLLIQIINIILLIEMLKEKVNKKKITIAIIIAMIIVTVFVPVKSKRWSKLFINHKSNNSTNNHRKISPEDIDVQYMYEYENIYGITIKTEN